MFIRPCKSQPVKRAVLVAALLSITASASLAAAERRQFEVAAGSAAQTLNEFSRQAEIQLLFDSDAVRSLHTHAVFGELDAAEALGRMLVGTDLVFEFVNERTVAVMRRGASQHATPSTSAAGQARGETKGQKQGTSRWQRFRQAQVDQGAPSRSSSAERQDTSSAGDGKLIEIEEIVVTGSHIRGVRDTASPTFSLTRKDFAESGATTAHEMLRRLPQNFTGGASDYSSAIASGRNGGDQNSNAASGVNLRGLGNSSTLVLLNGRRIAASGLGAFVDVSSIPLTALERIDVITDGASAIYGSDAVGGVVNFILRNDFDGAETSVRYGGVTDGALREFDASQVLGTTWNAGSALLTLDYQDQSALDAADRGYASALTQGPTYLKPEQQLWSALFDAHQELGSSLTLSGTAYFNKREAFSTVFSPNTMSQTSDGSDTRQAGGTLAADWSLTPSWTISLAHTHSRADTDKDARLAAGVQSVITASNYVLHSSATELSADGPLFDAPGGPLRLAFGAEHRSESLDRILVGQRSPVLQAPFALDRDIDALFAELNVPLVGSQNTQSWAKRLDLIAAVRYEEYSDFGSTADPKVGLVWSPMDGFKLRATYGTSFRAPYLNQFDDAFAVPVLYREGLAPTGTVIAAITQAAGSGIGPEQATTWTAGFDVRAEGAHGLEISATYFDVDYVDRLVQTRLSLAPTSDPLLSSRLSTPPDPEVLAAIAAVIARDPGKLINLTGGPLSSAEMTFDARLINTAGTNVSGVDLVVSSSFDTAAGQFRAGLNASYLLEFENQPAASVPPADVVDTVFFPVDLRLQSSLSWSRGSWSAAAFINYVDDYRDNQLPTDVRNVASWTTIDASAAYAVGFSSGWGSGLSFRFNVLNVLDRPPPTIFDRSASYANPGYDTENAHPLGRYLSFELSKRW